MATTKDKTPAKKTVTKKAPAKATGKVELSVIVPIYNEEESLPHLVKRIAEVMNGMNKGWELICVNDGSSDSSEAVMAELAKDVPQLKPLNFRRNFGQTAAMQAGFDHAQGDVFITMDGDLQNDPADIPMMLEKMKEEGADIVSGWRKNRKDDGFRTYLSKQANKLVCRMTGVNLHDTGCSLKIYKAKVMKGARIYGELHRFIPAVVAQFGAKVIEVEVTHHAREFGVSKYGNIGRMFRVVLDLLALKFFSKFIHRPMHAFGMVGLASLIPGGIFFAYLVLIKILGQDIGHRPLLTISIMMILIGVQLIAMGVLGEMLVRIYHEPKGRKQYTLKDEE